MQFARSRSSVPGWHGCPVRSPKWGKKVWASSGQCGSVRLALGDWFIYMTIVPILDLFITFALLSLHVVYWAVILAHFDYLNSLLLNCEVCNFNLLTFLLCVASQQVTFSLTHCWHIALLTHSLTSLCACLCVRRTVGRSVGWTFSWSIFSKRAGSFTFIVLSEHLLGSESIATVHSPLSSSFPSHSLPSFPKPPILLSRS